MCREKRGEGGGIRVEGKGEKFEVGGVRLEGKNQTEWAGEWKMESGKWRVDEKAAGGGEKFALVTHPVGVVDTRCL